MMTGVGVILGTAAYMAPEQARGKAVDKRADIWAFGCVLYEMLTGDEAFAGDDVSEVPWHRCWRGSRTGRCFPQPCRPRSSTFLKQLPPQEPETTDRRRSGCSPGTRGRVRADDPAAGLARW